MIFVLGQAQELALGELSQNENEVNRDSGNMQIK